MNEFIKVFLRIRPLNNRENKIDNKFKSSPLSVISENSVQILSTNDVLTFNFDKIFAEGVDEHSSQTQIFDTTTKHIIHSTVDGYNSTIFSYGATGTGKSYTMFGNEKATGIIPRACTLIFSLLEKKELLRYEVKLSFIEIYCEQIRDLLAYAGISQLKLRESISTTGNEVYIEGAIEKTVSSAQNILNVIAEHSLNRITASTALNNRSSRSHAVVIIKIIQNFSDGTSTISRMNLVDLAGSENVGKSLSTGVNLVEAQMINKSLSSLGNVIYALTEKMQEKKHIPYRDSKLTFLLRDSLGGNSKCALIATATYSEDALFETISTLRFAQRAKNIKNDPRINRLENSLTLNATVKELLEKIDILEKKYEEAKQTITFIETKHNPPVDKQALLYKKKFDRVNEQISILETEFKRKDDEHSNLSALLVAQQQENEVLTFSLCEERIKNVEIASKLKRYTSFVKGLIDNKSDSNVLEILIKNFGELEK